MIEVSDNGSGVEENNFEGLTLKHYTSKLEDFSDLINVETFGFRGEALSSLCALSDLCVVTRHKDVQVGNKLEFDHQGRITCKTSIARQTGTTVTLQNLFYTLPVRHKEFQRNLKKEFVKMVQVLNAYCLINTGVRITCTNQTGKGSRTTVVSSKGNPTIKENISNIFGPKQLQSLKEFCQCKPTEEVSLEYGLKSLDSQTELFKIEGYISKCEHGQGRSSADRQFYFINKRPCDHSKLSKLVNEVYHQYNRHQYPFVVISITMCRESVDVNVTPDKRQIFIENEKILLAVIKTSLIQMYEVTTGVYTDNTIATQNQWNCLKKSPLKLSQDSDCNPEESPVLCKPSITSTLNSLKRSFRSTFSKSDEDSPVVEQHNKQRRIDTFVIKSKSLISPEKEKDQTFKQVHQHECMELSLSTFPIIFETQETIAHKQETNCESQNSLILVHEQREIIPTDSESGISSSQELTGSQSSECFTVSSKTDSQHQSQESEEDNSNTLEEVKNECLTPLLDSKTIKSNNIYCELRNEVRESFLQDRNLCSVPTTCVLQDRNLCSVPTACVLQDRNLCSVSTTCVQLRSKLNDTYCNQNENDEITEVIITGSPIKAEPKSLLQITLVDEKQDNSRAERTVKFSFQAFRDKVNRRNTYKKTGESFCRTFRAKISPTDNKAAEEELQKEVKKETFSQMDILGQFNLGFIITKFRDDLFIVDQHATDEKYNFEMLQRHTVIQSQRLIHPQSLELTSSNEIILMDNIEVFRKNGFDFLIDEQGDPTQRVKLISTPVSKNWTFGKDDIEELIFMLTDTPGTMCRPSRVRQMFASRACRKSVMIGTALNKTEMKKLVDHMGQIDQPWNCPHGRPTMRHLINLNMIPK